MIYLQRILVTIPFALLANYLVMFVYSSRNDIGIPSKYTDFVSILAEIFAGAMAMVVGFFAYISRLMGSQSTELKIFPSTLTLWLFLLGASAVLYFILPTDPEKLQKVYLALACLPMLIVLIITFINQIKAL